MKKVFLISIIALQSCYENRKPHMILEKVLFDCNADKNSDDNILFKIDVNSQIDTIKVGTKYMSEIINGTNFYISGNSNKELVRLQAGTNDVNRAIIGGSTNTVWLSISRRRLTNYLSTSYHSTIGENEFLESKNLKLIYIYDNNHTIIEKIDTFKTLCTDDVFRKN